MRNKKIVLIVVSLIIFSSALPITKIHFKNSGDLEKQKEEISIRTKQSDKNIQTTRTNIESIYHYNDRNLQAQQYGFDRWWFSILDYRIPIIIANVSNFSNSYLPVIVHFNFTNTSIRPYNYSLSLALHDTPVDFQLINYISNGTHLVEFDLVFSLSDYYGSSDVFYLYFSPADVDLSSYGVTSEIYSEEYYNNDLDSMNISVGYMRVDFYNVTINGELYKFMKVYDDAYIYNFLLSYLRQHSGYVGLSSAIKSGLIGVVSNETGSEEKLFDTPIYVNSSSLNLSDLEDTLNGPYRFMSHALFVYNASMDFYGVYAPMLENASIKRIVIGPIYVEVSFELAPLGKYYEEGSPSPSTIDVYENITFCFSYRSGMIRQSINIINNMSFSIFIDDNSSDLGLTDATYGSYRRFTVSPDDVGSMLQFYTWVDDEENPEGNYTRMGNTNGIPDDVGYTTISNKLFIYGLWTENSLGRSSNFVDASLIMQSASQFFNVEHVSFTGSYMVYPNDSFPALYDGMYSVIGFNFPRFPILSMDNLSLEFTLQFDSYASVESVYYRMKILAMPITILNDPSSITNIQYINSTIHISLLKLISYDMCYTNATLDLYYNNKLVPYSNYTIESYEVYYYKTYYYSTILTGNFTAVITKVTDVGLLNYTVNISILSNVDDINITLPLMDLNVSLYNPSDYYVFGNETEYYYFSYYYVQATLLDSNYTETTMMSAYTSAYYDKAIVKNLILGSYMIKIEPDIYTTYGVPCDETYNLTFTWSNASYEIVAYADVAKVNFVGFDSEGNNISYFTLNLSGIGSYQAINSSNGVTTFMNVPLENRTNAQGILLNATIIYRFMNIGISNSTLFSVPENNYNLTMYLGNVHALFVSIYSKARENFVSYSRTFYLKIYIKNGTQDYYHVEPLYSDPYAIISVPDSSLYNLDLFLKARYETYDSGFIIKNETHIGPVTGPTNVTIIMPMILSLQISFVWNNGTENGTIFNYVEFWLSTLNNSYMYSTSTDYGYVFLEDIPSDVKFNVTAKYWTKTWLTLVSTSFVTFNDSYFEVIFYYKTMRIYAAPQYNMTDFIAGVSLDCYINFSYIGYGATNKFGYIGIEEFPHPMYGYINLTVYYYWNIYDYYIEGHYSFIINESVYYNSSVTILLPLKIVYFNLTSPNGVPMDGSVDIYSGEMAGQYLTTITIEKGKGTFKLCPIDNLHLVLIIKSKWGFSLVVEQDVVLQDPSQTIHIVAPLETADIYVESLDGIPLGNAEVSILMFDAYQNILAEAFGMTNINGTVYIDEIPQEGSKILLNETPVFVDYILIAVRYRVMGDYFVFKEDHLDTYQKMISMPLGKLMVFAYYNSSNGKVYLSEGVVIDLLIKGNVYERLNLSISNIFELVPYNESLILYMTYETRYNFTMNKAINYRLLESEAVVEIAVPIGDFMMEFVDFDNEGITNLNITLKTYGILYEILLNNTNQLNLTGMPFGIYEITIGLNTSIGVAYKQIVTLNFDKTGLKLIKINIRTIRVLVYDESGEPLNGLVLLIKRGYYEMDITIDTNEFILTNIPMGIYMLSLYYYMGYSMYPLNYTDYPIDINTVNKTVTLCAKFTSPYSEVVLNKTEVYQYETLRMGTYIYDADGNAIVNLSVVLELRDFDGNVIISNQTVEEYPGCYVGYLKIGNVPHGSYKIVFEITTRGAEIEVSTLDIKIRSMPPEISFSMEQYIMLGLIIILFSLAVSILQYRLSKISRREPVKNIRYMAVLYGLGMITALSLFGLSYVGMIEVGYRILAYAISFLLVIILYGLWIYMDGYRAIKLQKPGKISLVLGLVHMIIPIYIMMQIISEGAAIEWFQEYIIEQQTSLGPFQVPALFASFLSAYVTTYLVVVFTAYRDISKAHKRVVSFSKYDVPKELIENEAHYQLMRLSGGIRIRILLFLGLLGVSLVTSLPFLQNVALLIVVIPIVLLIIGPYMSYVLTGYITKSSPEF